MKYELLKTAKMPKNKKLPKIQFNCGNCEADITQLLRPLWGSDKIFYEDGTYSITCDKCNKCEYTLNKQKGDFILTYQINKTMKPIYLIKEEWRYCQIVSWHGEMAMVRYCDTHTISQGDYHKSLLIKTNL